MLQQYISQALSRGFSVAVLSSNSAKPNIHKVPDGFSSVTFLTYPVIDHWSLNAFLLSQRNHVAMLDLRGFKPSVIHIIDWVGLHPSILVQLRLTGAPVLRQILNFEDRCYFITPIFNSVTFDNCEPDLEPDACKDCILRRFSSKDLPRAPYFRTFLKNLSFKYLMFKSKLRQMSRNRVVLVENDIEQYFDHLLFPSQSFAEYFISHIKFQKPYSVVELGLPLPQIRPMREPNSSRPLRFIYAGGPSFLKGFQVMQDVFLQIINVTNIAFELRVYGVASKFAQQSQLSQYGNISFYDNYDVANGPDIYGWADVGIVPTHFETFCRLVREFILCGVVPISTYAFGIPDLIIHDHNGLLIEKPYHHSLFAAIQRLAEDPDLLARLRQGVHNTSVVSDEGEYNKIIPIYSDLTNRKSAIS